VKTLSDLRGANAPKLKRNAERRTIHYLVTQEHEAIGKHTARLAGVERTKYVLTNVALVEAKVEQDQDVHLVIRDEHGKPSDHMIVEFPNVECNVTAPTKNENDIAQARADVDDLIPTCRIGFKKGWAQFRDGTTATVRGVGFFDLAHGSNLHGRPLRNSRLGSVPAYTAPSWLARARGQLSHLLISESSSEIAVLSNQLTGKFPDTRGNLTGLAGLPPLSRSTHRE
jgi:hypothetical protein